MTRKPFILGVLAFVLAMGALGFSNKRSVRPSPIAWIELGTTDLRRAKSFYAEIFGWQFTNSSDSNVVLLKSGNLDGTLNLVSRADGGRSLVLYLQVDRLQATLEQAVDMGARIISSPNALPGKGSVAVIEDLDGNRLGIFSTEALP